MEYEMALDLLHERSQSTADWRERVDASVDVGAVVRVVQDFLATWTSEEIARLPRDCRPGAMGNAQQVNVHALKLAHGDIDAGGTSPELRRMTSLFTKAALRIFQLLEEENVATFEARRDSLLAQPERVEESSKV